MTTGMSRNQQDAAARKRHRERRIERVQRERDIAEVFVNRGIWDTVLNNLVGRPLHETLDLYGETVNPFASFARGNPIVINGTNLYQSIELDACLLPQPSEEDKQVYGMDFETRMIMESREIKAGKLDWRDIQIPFSHIVFEFHNPHNPKDRYVVGLREMVGYRDEGITRFIIIKYTSSALYHSFGYLPAERDRFVVKRERIGVVDEAFDLIQHCLNICHLLTMCNIELVDQPPNPRLSAISEREFGRPLTTYKVLKVNTGHKEYRGQDANTGLKDFDPRRMHVVRGHHAEYGTNGRKLLFGKYERKIWIPAHVRGNEERGIVVKDYEVVNHDG